MYIKRNELVDMAISRLKNLHDAMLIEEEGNVQKLILVLEAVDALATELGLAVEIGKRERYNRIEG